TPSTWHLKPYKVLLVSAGAADGRRDRAERSQPESRSESLDLLDDAALDGRRADDSSLRDFAAACLELRFDDDGARGAGSEQRGDTRQHEADREEGEVHCRQRHRLGDLFPRQPTRVDALAQDDPRIRAQLRVELPEADVDRIDAAGSALEQAVGES